MTDPTTSATRRRKSRFEPAPATRWLLLGCAAVLVFGSAQLLTPARSALVENQVGVGNVFDGGGAADHHSSRERR